MKKIIVISTLISLIALGLFFGAKSYRKTTAFAYVKEHPVLQDLCDKAGSCWFITLECTHYDNKGNTSIRNMTSWHIDGGDSFGVGNYKDGESSDGVIERAAQDWKENLKYRTEAENDSTIYPNSSPCTKDCRPKAGPIK
jgi:hypothetical protein